MMIYQITVNDLAYFKSQQWSLTNHSSLLLAALVGTKQLLGESTTPFELTILAGLAEPGLAEKSPSLEADAKPTYLRTVDSTPGRSASELAGTPEKPSPHLRALLGAACRVSLRNCVTKHRSAN
jgi:hypothetical protein